MGRLFPSGKQTVRQASVFLAIASLMSNALGLIRNWLFFRLLDPNTLDSYSASFRVADFLFSFVIVAAVTSTIVPALSEKVTQKDKAAAHKLTNSLISWSLLIFCTLSLVLFFSMHYLVMTKIAPGYSNEKQILITNSAQILLLQPIIFSTSFILGGLLNAQQRFTSFALAPLAYNASIIIGAILAHFYGLLALSWMVVLGSALHLCIQYTAARKTGWIPQFTLDKSKELTRIALDTLPRSISLGSAQLITTTFTSLISTMRSGALAVFTGINDLQTTPIAVVGSSLGTAMLPTLSSQASLGDLRGMSSLFDKALRSALFVMLPVLTLMYVLRAQIVRLYVGIGHFDWELTIIAIQTLVAFLVGILFAILAAVLTRIFFALKENKTPAIVSVTTAVLVIVAAQIGVRYYAQGVPYLALLDSLMMVAQAIWLFTVLHRRNHLELSLSHLGSSFVKYGVGALASAGVAWATLYAMDRIYTSIGTTWLSTTTILGLFVQLLVAGLAGTLTYFAYSWNSCNVELQWILKSLSLKKPKPTAPPTEAA